MLDPRLVPSPLLDPATVPPIRIAPQATITRGSSFRLFFRLLGFGMTLWWAARVRRLPAATVAQTARDFLEGLGGLWIKAGQLLSLRVDLLSREMVDQLQELQHQSYGFDPAVAREVVERELGRPIDDVFSVFEEHPFAAASISQLHRAQLQENGAWVAVKIQRPGMARVLARDLGLISWILRRMKIVPRVSYIGWDGMIRELERMLHEEVDYRYEVANLRRMRKILRKHRVYVPKVYRRLCTTKVIVMEYLPGVVMSDYLRVRRADPRRLQTWENDNGIDPYQVGKGLMLSFYRQLYEETIFHGDLHPGNIMLLRDNRIALIDFGTVGNLEKKFVALYGQLARAIAQGDYGKGMDIYLLLADAVPAIDTNAYRAEGVEVTRAWEARSHLEGLTFLERSITGGLGTDLAEVNQRYKVNPSWQFLRVARSVSTMDANLGVLLENENPVRLLRKYFRQARRRNLRRLRRDAPSRIANGFADVAEGAAHLSESLRRQAIQMRGAQSKVSQVFGVLAALLRLVIVIVALVFVYDFLHTHHFDLIAGINDSFNGLARFVESTPPLAYEVGLIVMIALVLLFFVIGRIRRILAREPVRTPTGRVEG
ncbi:MAG TPA: AarF/UbiB family protein [Microbacterium sp.]|nr:AarF/UbiB family protein [Microbacterium sp.]